MNDFVVDINAVILQVLDRLGINLAIVTNLDPQITSWKCLTNLGPIDLQNYLLAFSQDLVFSILIAQ